jgi:DnaJ-class molecular chaperone
LYYVVNDSHYPIGKDSITTAMAVHWLKEVLCQSCGGDGCEPTTDGGDRCLACRGVGFIIR